VTATILFDLGSTVVQMDALKARSYALAAQELDACINRDAVTQVYEEVVGLSREEVANAILARFGLHAAASEQMATWNAEAPWQAFARLRFKYFEAILADPDLLRRHRWPYAEALLEVARTQECKVALTTMVCCEVAQRILAATGLEGAFDVLVASDDVAHPKPDPEVYHLAANLLEVPATACLVVESSQAGVQTGLAAGMGVVALATPFTRDALEAGHLIPISDIARNTQQVVEVVTKKLHAMPGGT
jgi:beta-phosphoglucomutase-like phosphatase (HAD superfamily)